MPVYHKLQIVFRFLPTIVQRCMIVMHVEMNNCTMFCVTDVYLGDISNILLYFSLECELS